MGYVAKAEYADLILWRAGRKSTGTNNNKATPNILVNKGRKLSEHFLLPITPTWKSVLCSKKIRAI